MTHFSPRLGYSQLGFRFSMLAFLLSVTLLDSKRHLDYNSISLTFGLFQAAPLGNCHEVSSGTAWLYPLQMSCTALLFSSAFGPCTTTRNGWLFSSSSCGLESLRPALPWLFLIQLPILVRRPTALAKFSPNMPSWSASFHLLTIP